MILQLQDAYYYDNSTSATAYSPQQPMHTSHNLHSGVAGQQQYNANAHVPQQNIYKPDDASKAPY